MTGIARAAILASAILLLPTRPPVRAAEGYAIGADLSFLKQQEDAGKHFKDAGIETPGLRIFRDHGYAWIRLRLFHTPASLPNSLGYTLAMAKEAKALGFRFLLDFHYSDTWADPGNQTAPEAWKGLTHAATVDSVYAYTREVIARFRAEGVLPDMVQVGNEINNGMIWPDGKGDWNRQADLLKAGVRYDVIGQSYYPLWHGTLADLEGNLAFMAGRYAKDIIVVETAFSEFPDGGSPFPLTDEGQVRYLRAIDAIVRATPNGRGKGWMWWEPTWDATLGGPRGLFDKQLNARPALSVFDGVPALHPAGYRPEGNGAAAFGGFPYPSHYRSSHAVGFLKPGDPDRLYTPLGRRALRLPTP